MEAYVVFGGLFFCFLPESKESADWLSCWECQLRSEGVPVHIEFFHCYLDIYAL